MSQVLSSSSARFLWNKIATKLGIAVATLLIPAIVLTYLLFANINDQMNFARGEVYGAEYLTYCRNEVAAAVEHRRQVADYLTGGTTTPTQLAEQQGKVKENLDRIEEIDRKLTQQTHQIHTRKAIDAAHDAWKSLAPQLAAAKPGDLDQAREVLLAYDKYVAAFLDVMTGAADGSKLLLDPEYGAYGLMNNAQKAMQDANLLGRVEWRATLAAAAKDKGLSTERKFELAQLLGTLDALKGDLDGSFENLAKERPTDISPALKSPRSLWDEKRKVYLDGIENRVVRSDKVELPATKLAETASDTRAAVFALFDVIQPLLVKDLETRLSGFRRTLILGFTAITVGLLLALGVVYVITRGFTRQIRAYLNVFAVADKGDYTARVEKITSDELGEMAISLNNVLGTTDTLIKKQKDDYEQLQHSIMKLLEDVAGAADGDLTRQAEVTADATGAIADSFNHMIDHLRKIIGDVQDATTNVSASATQIQAGTEQLVSGSEHQAEQIVNTSTAIDEMAVSIQQVSDNANVAANIAKDAMASATKGNESVSNTIAGMSRIRDQAQETAKRIKRLGESSQEIGQIIQLIEDIADRTSILALNASIQAAAAGEAGRGFAVVAAEVERLAERSTEATKKIASLIRTIQSETNEAVSSMEKGINEVVEGSKLANQAGQSLEDIQAVSKRLAELIHSISLAANQQARGSDELAKSMNEISTITQDTAQGTKQAADSVSQLAALADNLRSSVSTFRLPDQPRQQPKTQPAGQRGTHGNGHAHAPSRSLAGAR